MKRVLNKQQREQANKRAYAFKEKDKKIHPERYITYNREYRLRHPEKELLNRAQKRAKTRGLTFNLTESDILIPSVCPILDIPIFISKGMSDNSISIDRVDNTLGYVRGNIQVISNKANAMKNSATPAELKKFAAWVNKTYGT